jgi:hypothetical protein
VAETAIARADTDKYDRRAIAESGGSRSKSGADPQP